MLLKNSILDSLVFLRAQKPNSGWEKTSFPPPGFQPEIEIVEGIKLDLRRRFQENKR